MAERRGEDFLPSMKRMTAQEGKIKTEDPSQEEALYSDIESGKRSELMELDVKFSLSLDEWMGHHDKKFSGEDIICITDDFLDGETGNGDSIVYLPGKEKITLKTSVLGTGFPSLQKEMLVIEKITSFVMDNIRRPKNRATLWILTDSEAALAILKEGPNNLQYTTTETNIWLALLEISRMKTSVRFQLIPGPAEDRREPQDKVLTNFDSANIEKKGSHMKKITVLEMMDMSKHNTHIPRPLPHGALKESFAQEHGPIYPVIQPWNRNIDGNDKDFTPSGDAQRLMRVEQFLPNMDNIPNDKEMYKILGHKTEDMDNSVVKDHSVSFGESDAKEAFYDKDSHAAEVDIMGRQIKKVTLTEMVKTVNRMPPSRPLPNAADRADSMDTVLVDLAKAIGRRARV